MKFARSTLIPIRVSLAAATVVVLLGYGYLAHAQESNQYAEFEKALDDAIKEVRPDYEERLQLVARTMASLGDEHRGTDRIFLKARYVRAVANMRLGNFDASLSEASEVCPTIPRTQLPGLRFRCDTLKAYLHLIGGERERSLDEMRTAFARVNDGVPDDVLTRARIGYAVVLYENGLTAQAVEVYEQVLISAIARQDDLMTLYAGNNLIVILISLEDYAAAQETLDQLELARRRNPNSLVAGSLMLHEYELQRVIGNAQTAAEGLSSFIDERVDTTPLMLGSAHLLLADSLRDMNRLGEALVHGRQALELLAEQANEVTNARLSLAETLIRTEDYAAATALLSTIVLTNEPVPAVQVRYARLLLAARLHVLGDAQALAAYAEQVDAYARRNTIASTTRAEFYQAKLTIAQQNFALRKAAEAARNESAQRAQEKRFGLVLLVWVVVASFFGILLLSLQFKRSAERRVLAEKTNMNQQLERNKRFEAIGVLTRNIAHDFNNLLQVVASSNESINTQVGAKNAAVATAVAHTQQALDHGAKIVGQLLAFGRRQEAEPGPVSIGAYLERIQSLLASALGERIHLNIEDRSDDAVVAIDRTLLTTSLLNLATNSVDAMPAGGEVTLSADRIFIGADSADWLGGIEPGQYVRICLADTGSGMSSDVLERSIEPFFTTKDANSGSGLGLSSVYAFARQYSGGMRLHSTPGLGTKIELALPLVVERKESRQQSTIEQQVDSGSSRILMVEDNDMIAKSLESLLKAHDFVVSRACDAAEAKAILESHARFDLLLSDIRMPGELNGVQLAEWARANYATLQIILMSGYVDYEQETLEFKVLRKPFKVADLKDAMQKGREQTPTSLAS